MPELRSCPDLMDTLEDFADIHVDAIEEDVENPHMIGLDSVDNMPQSDDEADEDEEERQHIQLVVEEVVNQHCNADLTKCAAHVIQPTYKDCIKLAGPTNMAEQLKDTVRYIRRLSLNRPNPPYPQTQTLGTADVKALFKSVDDLLVLRQRADEAATVLHDDRPSFIT